MANSSLGIPPELQCDQSAAISLLETLDKFDSPCAKMHCIKKCNDTITRTISENTTQKGTSTACYSGLLSCSLCFHWSISSRFHRYVLFCVIRSVCTWSPPHVCNSRIVRFELMSSLDHLGVLR